MGSKIRINGLKLSPELIQINIVSHPEQDYLVNQLLRSLAENKINCPLVLYSATGRSVQGVCCINRDDSPLLMQILSREPDLDKALELISAVGALSVFPHQFSLRLLGCLMRVVGTAELPMYGLAASLSALTFTTDYGSLDKAVEMLKPHLSLPQNHAPFRPQFRIKAV